MSRRPFSNMAGQEKLAELKEGWGSAKDDKYKKFVRKEIAPRATQAWKAAGGSSKEKALKKFLRSEVAPRGEQAAHSARKAKAYAHRRGTELGLEYGGKIMPHLPEKIRRAIEDKVNGAVRAEASSGLNSLQGKAAEHLALLKGKASEGKGKLEQLQSALAKALRKAQGAS